MKPEHRYPTDYTFLLMLDVLKTAMDDGRHDEFSKAMYGAWICVCDTLPVEARTQPPCLVLDAYFANAGDLGKSLQKHHQNMADTIGYADHQDAMVRVKQKKASVLGEFYKLFRKLSL